jgi:hypothetical protein
MMYSFREGAFSVECLVDRVKLLSCKRFLGKNSDLTYSFYVGCYIGSRWIRRIGGSLVTLSYMWLILVSFFMKIFFLSWWCLLRGFSYGGGVPSFSLYFYLPFNFILKIVMFWWSLLLISHFSF